MRQSIKIALEVILYIVLFVLIQTLCAAFLTRQHLPLDVLLILTSGISSVITLALFIAAHWTDMGLRYISHAPATLWLWICLLTVALIMPLQYVEDALAVDMPDNLTTAFQAIIDNKWGYALVGILAPITEEVVFRGAILRKLLCIKCHPWVAIAVSALLFAAIHGNLAQGCHALIIGLLLGWLYVRTRSILPCLVVHWVNNTVAVILIRMLPGRTEEHLTSLFSGHLPLLYALIGVSVVVVLISLRMVARLLSSHR